VADDKDREGISAATFFAVVGQIFASMALVLIVASLPEDSWMRIAILCLLLLQMALYTGAMLWLRFRKKPPKEPPA
jgi:hypothetical protein